MKMNLFTLGLILTMTFNAQSQETKQPSEATFYEMMVTKRFQEVSQLAEQLTAFVWSDKKNTNEGKKEGLALLCNVGSKIAPTIQGFLTVDVPSLTADDIKTSLPLCSKDLVTAFASEASRSFPPVDMFSPFCDEKLLEEEISSNPLFWKDASETINMVIISMPMVLKKSCSPDPVPPTPPTNTVIE
jgi:hypothetical protein